MTIQAPCHAQRLIVMDNLHFINSAMAFNATNTTVYMNCVVEINIIWGFVYTNPWYWITRIKYSVPINIFII